MGPVVVDTSVVLGVLDPQDAHHVASVRSLRLARSRQHRILLPASAFAEVLVGASRLGADAVRTTEAFVDSIVDIVHPIDREVARAAAALRAGHKALRLPDALVLAVGRVTDASSILTADARWRGVEKRVQVVR
ncbi:type II toxin-antitoxin system VapC family toxin [bacterium]|nr:MAG: type II toxin-antitoxin system VapC family toxin [bacterium]